MWKLLIVDREQDAHQATKSVLKNFSFQEQGIQYHSAYAIAEAKEYLQSQQDFALVLLEMSIEKAGDGLELVDYIREELNDRAIRLIIHTSQAEEMPEKKVLRHHAINDFLVKGEIGSSRLESAMIKSLRAYSDIMSVKQNLLDLQSQTKTLRQSFEHLEYLDREKTKIIQFLYHELLTPLNHVGASQVFDEYHLSDRNRSVLEMVRKGFHRLNSVINAYLEYFSFMGKDLNIDARPLSIQTALREVIEPYHSLIQDSNLSIDLDIKLVDEIQADPGYLDQLLNILIDNAIRFSRDTGTISIRSELAEDDRWRLVIEDSGIGIAAEDLEQLFEVDELEAIYRRQDGFGLNLSKARYIVQSHGGNIWAESEGIDKGARFIIELPANQ